VIVGRALYQGTLSLQQALAIGYPPSTLHEEQAC